MHTLSKVIADIREQIILFKPLNDGHPVWRRVEGSFLLVDIKDFLQAQGSYPYFYWKERDGAQEIGALGVVHEVSVIQPGMCTGMPGGMRYFGGVCFDPQRSGAEWEEFPSSWFVLPRIEIVRSKGSIKIAVHFRDGEDQDAAIAALESLREPFGPSAAEGMSGVREQDIPSTTGWAGSVRNVLKAIRDEEVSKVVLARRTDFTLNRECVALDVLRQLQLLTPRCFHVAVQVSSKAGFYAATPERLYKRSGLTIMSEAIAGTRPRGLTPQEDGLLKNELLASAKEAREHQFVVTAIQESLKDLTGSLAIDSAAPDVVQLTGGQHLVTGITGTLKPWVCDADILKRLHPTPAVAGFPTARALEQIRTLEAFSRGWYAGPVGWFGREGSEFSVAIRSGLVRGNKLSVFAGAGIVEGSDSAAEWDEVEHKISGILKVLL
ncbi:MAG: isochorismate synthase [Candidatus Omnitrophica bacterium]|nr:isochorismate synthase [Candidatus Omnitrophota bacterium]